MREMEWSETAPVRTIAGMVRAPRTILAVLMLLVVALGTANAADASTRPTLSVSLDQPAAVEDTMPPVPGYVLSRRAEAAPTPENCMDGGLADIYCHLYKVQISIPDDVRARGGTLFTAQLDWDRGEEVQNVPQLGSVGTNQIVMRIYEEPKARDVDDAETYTAASGLTSTSPTLLGVIDPDKPFYWVLVANYAGAENHYRLTVKIDDLAGGPPPVDLSEEEDLPPVFTGGSATAAPLAPAPAGATVIGPAPNVGITGTTAAPALPSLPGLGAPDLALDGIGGVALGSDDLQEIALNSGPRPLPPAGDPSGALMLLWLVVVPLVTLALPVGFVWRRRREETVTT